MSRVSINVSGVHYEFNNSILKEYKFDKLTEMCDNALKNDKPLEFTVDRSSECFAAILSFYQTGELHMPHGVCPGQFKRELEFWEVDSDNLTDCCMYSSILSSDISLETSFQEVSNDMSHDRIGQERKEIFQTENFTYLSFLDELETRKKFLDAVIRPNTFAPVSYVTVTSGRTFQGFRTRLWNIVDYREKSLIAKVYFIALMLMVLLSVINMAFSTVPRFRRSLSKCEYLEYLKHSKHPMLNIVRARFGELDCSKGSSFGGSGDKIDEDYMDTWFYLLSEWYDDYYDNYDDYSDTTTTGTNVTNTTDTNGTTEAPELLITRRVPQPKKVNAPYLTVRKYIFDMIDYFLLSYFTIDQLLRLLSCPSLVKYFMSIVNIIDFCAVIGAYIHLIIISIEKQYRYEQSWLRVFDYFQVFRALRLFRIVRNVRASKVLEYSLRQNVKDGLLLLVLMLVGISTFATLFFIIEGEKVVDSIPRAWYWSVITMTTVGYGDISPTTAPGMVLASICACCGVILLAVALPMFVNNFLTLYQYSSIEDIQKQHKETKQKLKATIHTLSLVNSNMKTNKDANITTITVKP